MAAATQMQMGAVLAIAELQAGALQSLAARYGLQIVTVGDRQTIPGTFWGEPEAGIIGSEIFLRSDTPVHSALHEMSHVVCMDSARRASLERNAGGDDAEEAAVCYLQIVLADELPRVGSERLMRDMDAWGYSFRLGSTLRWFREDAADARAWLESFELLTPGGRASFRLRDA
ncbi:MAG: hypothetical protein WBM54_10660 [Woeseia sp.]